MFIRLRVIETVRRAMTFEISAARRNTEMNEISGKLLLCERGHSENENETVEVGLLVYWLHDSAMKIVFYCFLNEFWVNILLWRDLQKNLVIYPVKWSFALLIVNLFY